MHEVLVNRLEGLSLPRKSVVRLTDRPDMTLDVYRGRNTTMQQIIPADSTVNKLVDIYNTFRKVLDEGKEVRAIFCDVSKAFDRV